MEPHVKPWRVSLFGNTGLPLDSQYGVTIVLHVLIKQLAMLETPRVAAPTQEHQVQMFPYMTEGCVRVLIENSAVQEKGHLFLLPQNSKGLPC